MIALSGMPAPPQLLTIVAVGTFSRGQRGEPAPDGGGWPDSGTDPWENDRRRGYPAPPQGAFPGGPPSAQPYDQHQFQQPPGPGGPVPPSPGPRFPGGQAPGYGPGPYGNGPHDDLPPGHFHGQAGPGSRPPGPMPPGAFAPGQHAASPGQAPPGYYPEYYAEGGPQAGGPGAARFAPPGPYATGRAAPGRFAAHPADSDPDRVLTPTTIFAPGSLVNPPDGGEDDPRDSRSLAGPGAAPPGYGAPPGYAPLPAQEPRSAPGGFPQPGAFRSAVPGPGNADFARPGGHQDPDAGYGAPGFDPYPVNGGMDPYPADGEMPFTGGPGAVPPGYPDGAGYYGPRPGQRFPGQPPVPGYAQAPGQDPYAGPGAYPAQPGFTPGHGSAGQATGRGHSPYPGQARSPRAGGPMGPGERQAPYPEYQAWGPQSRPGGYSGPGGYGAAADRGGYADAVRADDPVTPPSAEPRTRNPSADTAPKPAAAIRAITAGSVIASWPAGADGFAYGPDDPAYGPPSAGGYRRDDWYRQDEERSQRAVDGEPHADKADNRDSAAARSAFEPIRSGDAGHRGSSQPADQSAISEYESYVMAELLEFGALAGSGEGTLNRIKDIYRVAEMVSPATLDKHFDQLLDRQRKLIGEFFEESVQ